MTLRVAFRTDASTEIGTGHLRRCLSLAAALEALGANICFVVRRHDGVAETVMAGSSYKTRWLPPGNPDNAGSSGRVPHEAWARVSWSRDAAETIEALRHDPCDWLIVDHYSFDAEWHDHVRQELDCSILAVDDLGDRSVSAEILLDANAAASHADKYAGKLSAGTRMLAGPRYAPLASTYRWAPRYLFSSEVRSIGVFLGGADAEGISARVLKILREDMPFDGRIEIVTTSTSPHLRALASACEVDASVTLSIDLPDLTAFYARHDLQIGAGGTSSYERCCIGAPTVAIVVAANQLVVVPILREMGLLVEAQIPGVEVTHLSHEARPLDAVLRALAADANLRRALSNRSRQQVDGRGAERVALSMFANEVVVRPARMDDAAMLHSWRNDPSTRAVSINTKEIAYNDHLAWIDSVLATSSRKMFVGVVGTMPIGAIRFDRDDRGVWEVSLYMDPGLHGLGLGKRMLLAGEKAISRAGAARTKIRAQVVPGNHASMKMFENAGYEAGKAYLAKVIQQEGVA